MRIFKSPVFYLVGSNLVFWGLPLLLIQLRSGTVAEVPASPEMSAAVAEAPPEPIVVDPLVDGNLVEQTPAPQPVQPAVVPPLVQQMAQPVQASLPPEVAAEPQPDLMRELKGAAGLGGPITLQSRSEPLMPIAARAERLQQKRSGDSLAALPRHWRESLRQELPASKSVDAAAVVRLPVPALKQRAEVPVIVDEHGQGEALVAPEDQRVRQAVESWAARQVPASPGKVQVYVVAAEPLSLE